LVRTKGCHDRLGVGLMWRETRVKCAQSAQCEPAVEWRAGDASTVGPPCEIIGECGVAGDDGATDHVTVAVQVLGGGVHHDVGAELDGALKCWREERVVYNEKGAGLL